MKVDFYNPSFYSEIKSKLFFSSLKCFLIIFWTILKQQTDYYSKEKGKQKVQETKSGRNKL